MKSILLFTSLLLYLMSFSQVEGPEIDSLAEDVMNRLDSINIDYITFDYGVDFDNNGECKNITYLGSNCDTCDVKAIKKLSKRGLRMLKKSYSNVSKEEKELMETIFDPNSDRYVVSQIQFSVGIYNSVKK